MFILFDVTDLDEESKRRIFQYFIFGYEYAHEKSTAHTFGNTKIYEINILTKEIKTHNKFKLRNNSYYIKVK